MWNSNDFLTWILYKFRIIFWMILYNFILLIYFSLQFLKLDFISPQTQFLYNFWELFSLSLQFLKLAFISLQFLKLTFTSLQFLILYDSDATPTWHHTFHRWGDFSLFLGFYCAFGTRCGWPFRKLRISWGHMWGVEQACRGQRGGGDKCREVPSGSLIKLDLKTVSCSPTTVKGKGKLRWSKKI